MKNLLNLITGEIPLINLLSFTFFTLIAMLLIKIWRYQAKKKRLLKVNSSNRLKFNLKHWFYDNILDFVTAFITSFLVYRFLKDVLLASTKYFDAIPNFQDDMFYGLLLGLSFQYVSHKLMNKLKV
ncbi:hypothetical protein [Tenacibaculum soleae]|uniref:hypothetical protein n=1 Tax=Tenacibaculum soleae TaxID=447689 RepID=UPI0023016821|nr:hypothetical protein [Tenacibaculum soleae]